MSTEGSTGEQEKTIDISKRAQKTPKQTNPLREGIVKFATQHNASDSVADVESLPRRFTLYEPLLLVPANFATHSEQWQSYFQGLSEARQRQLFESIVKAFCESGKYVSHVAISAPIAQTQLEGGDDEANVLRSPSNLRPVHGDFGPSKLDSEDGVPTEDDFKAAFWTSTSQVAGIHQVWAPRWTMFSRGNVTEKARILQQNDHRFSGLTEAELRSPLSDVEVVDLYVGIGYFAFCYLKAGVKRVWGWDLNPWSIEGLRRGCEKNGWKCVVVKMSSAGEMLNLTKAELILLLAAERGESVRCVAFVGDNIWAPKIMKAVRDELKSYDGAVLGHIQHINLGLLPSSRAGWKIAVNLIDSRKVGWLHIHENVEFHKLHTMAEEIAIVIEDLVSQREDLAGVVACQYIARVKVYAPRVLHCVFDIMIRPSASGAEPVLWPSNDADETLHQQGS